MSKTIDELLHEVPGIWRGSGVSVAPVESTGYTVLDGLLPGGGWPVGALTELIVLTDGIGELRLLMPALCRICSKGRYIVLTQPPYTPYAPALMQAGIPIEKLLWIAPDHEVDAHWAAEQALRDGSVGGVLLWTKTNSIASLRRLQLAASEGYSSVFVYRPRQYLCNASPASLRLVLSASSTKDALHIEVVKARGNCAGKNILCPL